MDVYNKNVANDTLYSLVQQEVIDEVNAILSGGTVSPTFIDVIINDELIFNNSGFTMTIKPTTLTNNQTITLPDASGTVALLGATQDISNKLYKARFGSALLPSYGFDSLPGTGMYQDGVGTHLHFSVNTAEKMRLTTSSVILADPLHAPDGTISLPSYTFTSNTDSGFYYETKSTYISCAIDGVRKLAIGSSQTINGNVVILPSGSAAAPTLAFVGIPPASTTGLFYRITGILGFASSGVEIANINSAGLEMGVGYIIEADDGNNEAAPSYTFTGSNSTGIYRTSADELSFTVGGTRRGYFSTSQLRLTQPIRTNDGSVSSPAYAFASDTDCGMYRVGTNEIAFTAGGAQKMRISNARIDISYNAGGTAIGFDRSDGTVSAGTLRIDSSNNFRLTSSSGGSSILLDPASGGFVRTNQLFASDLAYTGTTGSFRDLEVNSAGVIAYNSSSARYKDDIKNYDKGLADLLKIEPKTFRYTKDKIVERMIDERTGKEKKKIIVVDKEDKEEAAKTHIGLIAENLHEIGLTEFVDYDDESGLADGVRYKQLIVLCINAIKELAKKIS